MSTLDRRSVGELLADSDLLAREALLEMSANRALGMVREWPQLIKSAAELWAILPPEPTVSASGDPMAILAAMGSALRHSLAAGHWPGQGPTDESWEQIGANLTQARRLLQGLPVASEAMSTPDQTGPTAANTQVLHALYVAAHATAVALTGYERDLQRRLEVSARRRQPLPERPTAPGGRVGQGHDGPIRRDRTARCQFSGCAPDQRSRPTGNRSAPVSHPPRHCAGRLGDPSAPDTRRPPGPGRSGPGRPRAGAHRHNHRSRQPGCRAEEARSMPV